MLAQQTTTSCSRQIAIKSMPIPAHDKTATRQMLSWWWWADYFQDMGLYRL